MHLMSHLTQKQIYLSYQNTAFIIGNGGHDSGTVGITLENL